MKMIIATDIKGGIGYKGDLPWSKVPEDMKYFREKTEGQTVVMGRKTYDSLGLEHGLRYRENMVISSKGSEENPIFYSKEGILGFNCPPWANSKELWVIGGAEIYKTFVPYVQEVHWSLILEEYETDTKFDMGFLDDVDDEGDDVWEIMSSDALSERCCTTVWRRKVYD